MPRPPLGDKAMTATERSRRRRERVACRVEGLEAALLDLLTAAERGVPVPRSLIVQARKVLADDA